MWWKEHLKNVWGVSVHLTDRWRKDSPLCVNNIPQRENWRLHCQNRDKEFPSNMMDCFCTWSLGLPNVVLLTNPHYSLGLFEQLELQLFGDRYYELFSANAFLSAPVKSSKNDNCSELAFVIWKPCLALIKTFCTESWLSSSSERSSFERGPMECNYCFRSKHVQVDW